MRNTMYVRWTAWIAACLMAVFTMGVAHAQDYGTGAQLSVPYVEPGTITLDGSADEAAWENAQEISIGAGDFVWDGGYLDGYGEEPDIDVVAKLLFTDGQLLVHITFEHYDELYWGGGDGGFGGNMLLVGIDPIHEAGVSDEMETGWNGFAGNDPNEAPAVFYMNGPLGITMNFGGGDEPVDPTAEGFTEGSVFVDEDNFTWGVEMAINSSAVSRGSEVGFNVGGATALEEQIYSEEGEGDYAWFSWQTCDAENVPSGIWCGAGGNMLQNTFGYGTLVLEGDESAQYGTGAELDVPYVEPGTITLDGSADEAAWADAQVISIGAGEFVWDGGYLDGYGEEPDIDVVARLLHTDGQLLVHLTFEHYDELYWGGGDGGFGGNMLLVGIDPIHEAGVSDEMETGWDGFAGNDPNEAPAVFYMNGPLGITMNFGGGDEPVDPTAEGFTEGAVFVDEDNFVWGVEMAINSNAVQTGSQVGFNVGGATALEEMIYSESGEGDYAWFSWQTCDEENVPSGIWCGPGGNILQNTFGYGTLNLVGSTAIEQIAEVPSGFALEQNYPNPFNPSTTIEFGLERAGHVTVTIFNALGQRVATLADGVQQPGTYRVEWNAAQAPSGMYLYQLQVDGEVVGSRKMVLLR